MMGFLRKILVLIVIIVLLNSISAEEEKEDDIFVATNEWKPVRKGQKIPKGLHIRVNFETGLTEAKLLDPDETNPKDNALTAVPQTENEEDKKLLNTEVLKEALKKITSDEAEKAAESNKFRPYEELKKELADINLTAKEDAKIMQEAIESHEVALKNNDIEKVKQLLGDLEYLAHQFDNANDFVKLDGFRKVIYKNFNNTDESIKVYSLQLAASLSQNNPKVQIHILETGGLNNILRILASKEIVVKSAALSALGSLIRRFPLAQLRFVESGGLQVLTDLFEDDIKVQVKTATLINDLLEEFRLASMHKNEESLKQYKAIELEKHVLSHNWCDQLNNMLKSISLYDLQNHDGIEKALIAMISLADDCMDKFSIDILKMLQSHYTLMIENSDEDEGDSKDYLISIYGLIKKLIEKMKEQNKKTEL